MLSESMMDFLEISPGEELLSIRSSDIAFTMGARGPLLERAKNYGGDIPIWQMSRRKWTKVTIVREGGATEK